MNLLITNKMILSCDVSDIDLVFAAVGGNNIVERSLDVIKPNGRLISLLDEIDEKKAQAQNIYYTHVC